MQLDSFYPRDLDLFFLRDLCMMSLTTTLATRGTKAEDLTIAAQRDIAPVVRGNVGGQYGKIKWHQVSEEPVKKRQKK